MAQGQFEDVGSFLVAYVLVFIAAIVTPWVLGRQSSKARLWVRGCMARHYGQYSASAFWTLYLSAFMCVFVLHQEVLVHFRQDCSAGNVGDTRVLVLADPQIVDGWHLQFLFGPHRLRLTPNSCL